MLILMLNEMRQHSENGLSTDQVCMLMPKLNHSENIFRQYSVLVAPHKPQPPHLVEGLGLRIRVLDSMAKVQRSGFSVEGPRRSPKS